MSLYVLTSRSGRAAFSRKTDANSAAFSADEVAQVPSERCKAGMFSVVVAFVSSEFDNFHQPREERDMPRNFPRVLRK